MTSAPKLQETQTRDQEFLGLFLVGYLQVTSSIDIGRKSTHMYELPPANFSKLTSSRITVMPRIGVLILVWLLLLGGYAAYRTFYQPARSDEKKSDITPNLAAVPAEWAAHVGSLSTASFNAEASLRQAESEVRRTLAVTDSFVEARHLHAALANLEGTHQDLVRSRHDIESLEVLLKGDKSQ